MATTPQPQPRRTGRQQPPPASKQIEEPPSPFGADHAFESLEPLTGATRFMHVDKGAMNIAPSYQRDSIDWRKVKRMAATPNLCAFGALLVAHRDNKFWVVDGQHRWLAAQRRNDITELPCMVFDSTSIQVEAKLFVMVNMDRNVVRPLDAFRARVDSNEAIAVALQQVFDSLDITLVKKAAGGNELAAISAAYAMAERGMARAKTVLTVALIVSAGSPIEADIVRAFEYLDKHLMHGISDERFISRARKVGVHRMLEDIQKARAAKSTAAKQIGLLVLGLINHGLSERNKFLLKDV